MTGSCGHVLAWIYNPNIRGSPGLDTSVKCLGSSGFPDLPSADDDPCPPHKVVLGIKRDGKVWEQPECPSGDERVKELRCMRTMEHNWAVRKKGALTLGDSKHGPGQYCIK